MHCLKICIQIGVEKIPYRVTSFLFMPILTFVALPVWGLRKFRLNGQVASQHDFLKETNCFV